ncbi:protein tolkin-like [Cotesia typhae]|uniref:protein tolkin-like n=1 Tax=Cotesia typhae TaxID=2053667 RepID=UPI003D69EE84
MINSYVIHKTSDKPIASEVTRQKNLFLKKVKKSVTDKKKSNLWDLGIIHYEIEDVFTDYQRRIIKQGMRMWEESSCVQFIQRNPDVHQDYVAFTKLDCGCCYIENDQRNKGRSELSLANGCEEIYIVLHEVGHVLGFYHEHQHPDRDQYVEILHMNIEPGYRQEFERYSPAEVDTLGLPYDYDSTMHYAKNAFAYFNFLKTIVSKQTVNGKIPIIGNKKVLSGGDVEAVNILYNCPICGGIVYDKYGIIEAPTYSDTTFSTGIIHCEWKVVAAKGEKILLGLSTSNIFKSFNCISDYVEIRKGYHGNSTLLGRYCGTHETPITHLVDHYVVVTYVRLNNLNEPNVGFNIHYAVICGTGTVIPINEFKSYVLKSPNFPDAYDSFSNCLWEFRAPDNYKIKVKFDFFAIESSPDCKSDFLQIEDATKYEMPVIERYCGKQNPGEVDTYVNNIFIIFSTNNNNVGVGFQVEISAEPIIF